MEAVNKLKSAIKELFDNTDNKELISTLTNINGYIEEVESEAQKNADDFKELMSDYKELVKHTSFKLGNNNLDREVTPKAPELSDIIADVLRNRK